MKEMILYHELTQLYIINMKQQDQTQPILSQGWTDAIKYKFSNMSVLQLKKQKISMVKDLQEINVLLDELIQQQTSQQVKVQDIDKQIEKSKRLKRGLKKTLQNFQFMLSGDYSVKADDQIVKLKQQVKIMREQVSKFNRMLSIPMQKDIQICEQLQKQVYSLQKQLEQTKNKNKKKREQINQNNNQAQKKLSNAKNCNKEIQKIKQNQSIDGTQQSQNKEEHNNLYAQLLDKRQRILLILEKDQKRNVRQYQQKIKQIRVVEDASSQISNLLKQIDKTLQEKISQLKFMQKDRYSITKKQRNSDTNAISRRKYKTEQNSQIQILQRQRQIHYKNISRVKQKSSYSFMPRLQTNSKQSSEQILPRLYKALGKQKFQIQEDCDVKDLLYI